MKIKRIKIFANTNEKSLKLKKEVEEKLRENGFIIDNNKFDLGIAKRLVFKRLMYIVRIWLISFIH